MLLIFDQRNLKRTKYNTAITYKSSPSFLYILYSVHTFFFLAIFSHLLSIFCFVFLFKRQEEGCVWNSVIQANGQSMSGGPQGAPHLHVIAAPSSHLCWPESCGCCGLPCTEWHKLGL